MLHIITTMLFLGAGMFALAVIASMLIDEAPAVARALGLGGIVYPPLPRTASRVRVVRSPRLAPLSPARLRAAA